MNKNIMKKMGFKKEMKRIENNVCPFCDERINLNDFKDELSVEEYGISGLCQQCQDEIFEEYYFSR